MTVSGQLWSGMTTNTIYCSQLQGLADRFAIDLDGIMQSRTTLQPLHVIVPNPAMKTWLAMRLADQRGISANFKYQRLEQGLWNVLSRMDLHRDRAKQLTKDGMRSMLTALLLQQQDDAALAPVYRYLGDRDSAGWARKLWQLTDRLATNFREYEYQRYGMTRSWTQGQSYLQSFGASQDTKAMERCQMLLYKRLFDKDGLRDQLASTGDTYWVTLPQYTDLVLENSFDKKQAEIWKHEPILFFGLSQISPFHEWLLLRLGDLLPLTLYRISFCDELRDVAGQSNNQIRQALKPLLDTQELETDLYCEDAISQMRQWNSAAQESVREWTELMSRPGDSFQAQIHVLADRREQSGSQLHMLQQALLGADAPVAEDDDSIQMAACPSIYREVESVQQAIFHRLQRDTNLQLTDIAVLVTDVAAYRPVLESVFFREGERLPFNMIDMGGGRESQYLRALIDIMNLGNGSTTRREVFDLVFNPCFLAGTGLSREGALTWLRWTEDLNIYHGVDAKHRKRQGFSDDDRFTWARGLQRLRLGRIMQVDDDVATPTLASLAPYKTMLTTDMDLLNRFSVTMQRLLVRTQDFSQNARAAKEWHTCLLSCMDEFLAVPTDMPEEDYARDAIRRSLSSLDFMDDASTIAGQAATVPVEFVVEFLQSQAQDLSSRIGTELCGGVTVASMQALRSIPFKVLFVLGLDEASFPRRVSGSMLDLRNSHRKLGDIPPPDADRYLFYETVMAAGQALYCSYVSRDLQKDEEFYPSTVWRALQKYRFGDRDVIREPVIPPLRGDSIHYLQERQADSDYLAQHSRKNHSIALQAAMKSDSKDFDQPSIRELLLRQAQPWREWQGQRSIPETWNVSVQDLEQFMRNPAEALLRSALRLYDGDSDTHDALQEHEPLSLPYLESKKRLANLVDAMLRQDVAAADMEAELHRSYQQDGLQDAVPGSAFGDWQMEQSTTAMQKLLASKGKHPGLQQWMQKRSSCGSPVSIRLGAMQGKRQPDFEFPSLSLSLLAGDAPGGAIVNGFWDRVWVDDEAGVLHSLCYSYAGSKPSSKFSKSILRDVLYYASMVAGEESGAWVAGRSLQVHVLFPSGISSWTFLCDAESAREVLATLATDFWRGDYDMLPFDDITDSKMDVRPYEEDSETADYSSQLKMHIESQQEKKPSGFGNQMLHWIPATVPADAWDKVYRRYHRLLMQWAQEDSHD